MPISLLRSESKFYCILAKIEGRRAAVEGGRGRVGKKKKPPNNTLSFKIFLGMPQQCWLLNLGQSNSGTWKTTIVNYKARLLPLQHMFRWLNIFLSFLHIIVSSLVLFFTTKVTNNYKWVKQANKQTLEKDSLVA